MKSTLLQNGVKYMIAVLFICLQTIAEARIYFVSISATGTGDGSSWTNAFTDPQAAIDIASAEDTICVAKGVYHPTHIAGTDTIRSATFYINKSISIYGGFSGVPGTEGNFSNRNPKVHLTVLSGDVGLEGDEADNAFHVVYFDHVSDSTRLDGFIIADGNSLNGGGSDGTGCGIYNDASSGRSHPVIANCVIRNNSAAQNGGGMLNYAPNGGRANPMLINCTFSQNEGSGGGGISTYADTEGEASPTLIGCIFQANTARTADGGAMNAIGHSSKIAPTLVKCIISGNHSPNSSAFQAFITGTGEAEPEFINCAISGNTGGAIRVVDLGSQLSELKIRNCIVYGNAGGAGITTNGATVEASFSIIPFGFPGEGVIGLDPLFVSQPPLDSANTLGDLHLQDGSPAIDAGRNSDLPSGTNTDLDNLPRFVNPVNHQAGIVDIGPYEVQSITTGTSDFLSDTDWQVYPNPANDHLVINLKQTGNEGEIRILDTRGSVLTSQHLHQDQNSETLNLSHLPAGTYFVHLMIDGAQDVKKIVVQ